MDQDLYARIFAIEDHYWWCVGTRCIFTDWLRQVFPGRCPALLDVGCGSGALLEDCRSFATPTGFDYNREAVAYTHSRGFDRLCVATATTLPFRNATFDLVAAVDVLEHTDDRHALREMARVLRPGGAALFHVPAFPMMWSEHDVAAHHLRRYRRVQLIAVVREAGFDVERVSYVNTLLFPPVLVMRVVKRLLSHVRRPHVPVADIYDDLPGWLNTLLTGVLALERGMLRHVNLPVGVSLLCLARKPVPATA